MSKDLRDQLGEILAPESGEVGSTDVECNLISLRHDVHQMWNDALFGLKYVGNEAPAEEDGYSTFQAQWLWMCDRIHAKLDSQYLSRPKGQRWDPNAKHCGFKLTVDLESSETMDALHRALVDTIKYLSNTSCRGATVRDDEGRLIQSGRIFQLKVKTRDLEKTKVLLNTQLLALKMASLSGAAEDADYLDRQPPPMWSVDYEALFNPPEEEAERQGAGSGEMGTAKEHESGED